MCIVPYYKTLSHKGRQSQKCPFGCRGTSSLLPSLLVHLLIKFNICFRKRKKNGREAKVLLLFFFLPESFLCLLKLSHKRRSIISCPVQLVASPVFSAPLLFPAVPLVSCISFVALYSFEFLALLFFVLHAWSFQNVFSHPPCITTI